MILYIHGFGSCGDSVKSRTLKSRFGERDVLAPDLPVDPHMAIVFLEELIEEHDVDLLIGSSLGGYYAAYLADRYGIKSVLVNPSTRPYETLAAYVGENSRWCDGATFEWKSGYVEALKRYEVKQEKASLQRLVLLQSGDEVLDYRLAAQNYSAYEVLIEEGGNHRFENLDAYLGRIEAFYRR